MVATCSWDVCEIARVGREVLIGVLFGVALALARRRTGDVAAVARDTPPARPVRLRHRPPLRLGPLVAQWITWGVGAVQFSLLAILIVVVLRLACRWNWLALLLTAVCLSVSTWQYMGSSTTWLWAFSLASGALLTCVAVRFGLLTLVVAWFVWSALYGRR